MPCKERMARDESAAAWHERQRCSLRRCLFMPPNCPSSPSLISSAVRIVSKFEFTRRLVLTHDQIETIIESPHVSLACFLYIYILSNTPFWLFFPPSFSRARQRTPSTWAPWWGPLLCLTAMRKLKRHSLGFSRQNVVLYAAAFFFYFIFPPSLSFFFSQSLTQIF